MPYTRTHLALYNESETDISAMSPKNAASGTNVKHFFACDETASPIADGVTGDTVACTVEDQGDGSLKLYSFGTALVGGGGWTHPAENAFIFGAVKKKQGGEPDFLLLKGSGTGASITVAITSNVPSVKMDDGTTEVTATGVSGDYTQYANGTDVDISAVRNGNDLECVLNGVVVATATISSAFSTSFAAAAFADSLVPGGLTAGSATWGIFDYQIASLQSTYLAEIIETRVLLAANNKKLSPEWLLE